MKYVKLIKQQAEFVFGNKAKAEVTNNVGFLAGSGDFQIRAEWRQVSC